MRLIQWNLPPNPVPFPELVDVVVGLHDLELQRMLVLPGKPERIRVLQRRVGRVLEVRLRTATRSLAFHAFECPGGIGNVGFSAGLRSRAAPRRFSPAQPHAGNVGLPRRRWCCGPVRTSRYEYDGTNQPSQRN